MTTIGAHDAFPRSLSQREAEIVQFMPRSMTTGLRRSANSILFEGGSGVGADIDCIPRPSASG